MNIIKRLTELTEDKKERVILRLRGKSYSIAPVNGKWGVICEGVYRVFNTKQEAKTYLAENLKRIIVEHSLALKQLLTKQNQEKEQILQALEKLKEV